ncbi:MAG TPA: hypothetical protein PLP76_07490 [Bacteroidales bacterium]|nr:hypothetical protein [Bacteroidales bacterium]
MTDLQIKFDLKKATEKNVLLVEQVLKEADAHQYSVSKIYTAHNEIFDLKDVPQSCVSCLHERVTRLRKWYELYLSEVQSESDEADSENENTNTDNDKVFNLELEEVGGVIFKVSKGNKGTVKMASDGSVVKAGTYKVIDGGEGFLAVQPNGKATFRPE